MQTYFYGTILFSDSKKKKGKFKNQVYILFVTGVTYYFHNLDKK